jgi:hypothetical protein
VLFFPAMRPRGTGYGEDEEDEAEQLAEEAKKKLNVGDGSKKTPAAMENGHAEKEKKQTDQKNAQQQ